MEQQFAIVKSAVKAHNVAIFGNGKDGLVKGLEKVVSRLDQYFAVEEALRKEREKVQKRNNFKLNVVLTIIGIAGTVILATCAILALHANQTRSVLDDLNLSTSQYQYTIAERTNR